MTFRKWLPYAVGGAVVVWTSNAGATSVTKGGLALTAGTTYYVCVRAFDGVLNTGASRCSNGQTPDTAPPSAPDPVPARRAILRASAPRAASAR